MRILLPVALVAMLVAMPAPTPSLRAEIRAGHTAPLRIALAYRLGVGKRLGLELRAGMISDKGHPLRFSGDIALQSPRS